MRTKEAGLLVICNTSLPAPQGRARELGSPPAERHALVGSAGLTRSDRLELHEPFKILSRRPCGAILPRDSAGNSWAGSGEAVSEFEILSVAAPKNPCAYPGSCDVCGQDRRVPAISRGRLSFAAARGPARRMGLLH